MLPQTEKSGESQHGQNRSQDTGLLEKFIGTMNENKLIPGACNLQQDRNHQPNSHNKCPLQTVHKHGSAYVCP